MRYYDSRCRRIAGVAVKVFASLAAIGVADMTLTLGRMLPINMFHPGHLMLTTFGALTTLLPTCGFGWPDTRSRMVGGAGVIAVTAVALFVSTPAVAARYALTALMAASGLALGSYLEARDNIVEAEFSAALEGILGQGLNGPRPLDPTMADQVVAWARELTNQSLETL